MDEASRTLRKKEKTRQTLIIAAKKLVLERRGGKVSIHEITEAADLGLGTFYNYFNSKQDIFEAVAEIMLEEFRGGLDQFRSNLKDPATLMAHTIRYCVRENQLNEDWSDFLKYSGIDGTHYLEQTREQCAQDLLKGVRAGRFKIRDLDFATSLIQGMLRQVISEMSQGTMGADSINELGSCVLRMLGLPDVVARAIVKAPLPPVKVEKIRSHQLHLDSNSASAL